MKYSKAIDGAMREAKKYNETYIVFGVKRWWFGFSYDYGTIRDVSCYRAYEPIVDFMMITPSGRAVTL